MFNPILRRSQAAHATRAALLERILSDGEWHSTRELVRRVGHTFAGAKFTLVGYGHAIDKRKHPSRSRQYQYRQSDEVKDS